MWDLCWMEVVMQWEQTQIKLRYSMVLFAFFTNKLFHSSVLRARIQRDLPAIAESWVRDWESLTGKARGTRQTTSKRQLVDVSARPLQIREIMEGSWWLEIGERCSLQKCQKCNLGNYKLISSTLVSVGLNGTSPLGVCLWAHEGGEADQEGSACIYHG